MDWAAGVPFYWHDNASNEWRLQDGAPDPAQVINYSRGLDVSYDDSIATQSFDALVDAYGVTMTVAAGNSGPRPRSVNDPALAYNVIGVGAFSGGGTTDPSDDTVFGWSSRGPTVGGRKKPDLVAVGDGGLADSFYKTTGQLWKYDTGTSYAAPQVGGGAILLAGAGIRDPQVVKALLINSARPGRATPSSPMGTQVGWLPDWGWGEMNLDAAYKERFNFDRGEVPAHGARFFKATAQAPGDRATLVWHRRVADCKPVRQGCYYDTDSGFHTYALSNLDLAEYDASTGALRASSNSTVDNVEQVRAAAPGDVVYKVSTGHIDGPAAEPFALAATRPLTPLTTPKPSATMTIGAAGVVKPGAPVDVTAEVANPSHDLTAQGASATLELPAGVDLVSGDLTQPLGTLAKHGSTGDTAAAHWSVRGTTDGIKQLRATAQASRYGSTFTTKATATLEVDATPPSVTLAAPSASGSDIHLVWSGSDSGAGLASFDVEVSGDGNSFVRWLTSTSATSGIYPGARGARYRFRVRATDSLGNVSPYVASDEVRVGSPEPAPAPPPPFTAPGRASPQLKIRRVRQTGRRLVVAGSVAAGASGRIVALWRGPHRQRARATTYPQSRAFRLALRLPPRASRGTLKITYTGGRYFTSQTRRFTVRSR